MKPFLKKSLDARTIINPLMDICDIYGMVDSLRAYSFEHDCGVLFMTSCENSIMIAKKELLTNFNWNKIKNDGITVSKLHTRGGATFLTKTDLVYALILPSRLINSDLTNREIAVECGRIFSNALYSLGVYNKAPKEEGAVGQESCFSKTRLTELSSPLTGKIHGSGYLKDSRTFLQQGILPLEHSQERLQSYFLNYDTTFDAGAINDCVNRKISWQELAQSIGESFTTKLREV